MEEQSATRGERAFHHRDIGWPDSAQDLLSGGLGVEGAAAARHHAEPRQPEQTLGRVPAEEAKERLRPITRIRSLAATSSRVC